MINQQKKASLKRAALFVPGGVGDANSAMYIPSLVNLIQRLSDEFEITVYSFIKPDGDDKAFICGKAAVKYIPVHYNDATWKKMFHYTKEFYKDHRTNRYNLVHGLWGTPCGLAAVITGKLFNLPSMVTLLGGETASLPSISYGNMRHLFLRQLTLWTCSNTTALSVLTEYQVSQLRELGIKRNDIKVIPIGVDTKFFNGQTKRIPHEPLNFLHVGTINEVKDQQTLLRAFALISEKINSRLRLIGPDYLDGKIQNYARDIGINDRIEFYDFVDHSEITNHYQWADIMLHTSLHEAQGVVIAESAASGVMICGTKVGLISDLSPEMAISVKIGDYEALADEVLRLIQDKEKMTTMSQKAQSWAREHDLYWTKQQMGNLYLETIDRIGNK